jgi:DNA polymerase-3 subunit beta
MKFTCERDKILSAFQTAATVAPSRSPKPILQNVKLVVGQQEATLLATDMEVAIRLDVPGIQVESPGSALLPVGRFGLILRESTDAKLLVEADAQGTLVRGERSEFKLPGENPDEFPDVASFSDDCYHEMPARLLRELIRRTLFATDTESSRYALGGVLMEFETDKVIAVGTDGRRLAKMEGACQTVGTCEGDDLATIVPAKSMQLIERAFTDLDAEVRIAAHANDILLKSSRVMVYSRLVEGRFPKWRDVFPTRREAIQIELAVGPLYSALRQAAIVASEESRGIGFTFGDGTLVLRGETAEVGQARVELPIPYDGPNVTLALDHRFVADFFKVLDPEKVITFEIENADSAALLTTDDGYGYVVMPLATDR